MNSLSKLQRNRFKLFFRNLKTISAKSTYLVLKIYQNRISTYKQVFFKWKRETQITNHDNHLCQQVAIKRFKGFQSEKLIDVLNAFSKQNILRKRHGLQAFKLSEAESIEKSMIKDHDQENENETLTYNKLTRQLHTHKEAAIQAKIKSIVFQMMLTILNNQNN